MNEETREDADPETKKATSYFMLIGGIVLIAILAVILFGLKGEEPSTGPKTVEYDYFTFEEIGGMWQTNIQLDSQMYEAIFRFNPEQVKDVYITGDFAGFSNKPIYITFDPDSDDEQFKYLALASSELSLNLIRALNFSVIAACTKNMSDACVDRPVVTCADDKNVIYLVAKAPTQITLNNRCVTLSGDGFELLKSVDRVLFQWYKIMK